MKRTPFGTWPCSIARAVDLLGDWWTPLVLREAVFGTRRFEEFQRSLGIGRNVLAQRLNRLVDEGLMDRVPYQGRPLRHEYVLTPKGRDFFPVLTAILAWGDAWLADEEGVPVVLRHRTCGRETHAKVVCGECGEPLRLEDVEALAGPGLPAPLARAGVAAGRFGVRREPAAPLTPSCAHAPESAPPP
ncbi:helix-turn-helix transcriptional regulator [Yinghuangia sp. ASG 101]|uniref:winged helix-turn-helix transcriptional regulator n=1 Tax=Yinghuangia sp. ASG 101 TaxID=2896848 RepID=UPI001E53CD64|nr:helix-turn-helix domain-containing protein [Yinghuangia sp. ASG 101]UGQ15019.1 helix-turn-helix transcriptional regulator [Yinghuangia sp. ASG 101]